VPTAPRKACAVAGCPNTVPAGIARCHDHQGRATPRAATRSTRIYADPRWKALSARTLREEPTCRLRILCDGAPSEVADHIVEVEDGGAPFDRANTQGACHRCNVSKGQRAAQARRRRAS
jgi:5-methylcytosine-specific restriction enzyme A